jgi:hypothetical protein
MFESDPKPFRHHHLVDIRFDYMKFVQLVVARYSHRGLDAKSAVRMKYQSAWNSADVFHIDSDTDVQELAAAVQKYTQHAFTVQVERVFVEPRTKSQKMDGFVTIEMREVCELLAIVHP